VPCFPHILNSAEHSAGTSPVVPPWRVTALFSALSCAPATHSASPGRVNGHGVNRVGNSVGRITGHRVGRLELPTLDGVFSQVKCPLGEVWPVATYICFRFHSDISSGRAAAAASLPARLASTVSVPVSGRWSA
jgi:hypothetical protein